MTVMNTGYSTLEEAWGGDIAGRKNKGDQNRKKKPPTDPICELYDSKISNSSYNETDLVRFANEYYDKFDKSKYQRNMRTQPLSYEEVEREPSVKKLVISKGESRYDVSDKRRPKENSALFEKQFEMKLPPLYDGGECPSIPQEEFPVQRPPEARPVRGSVYAEWDDERLFNDKLRTVQEESREYSTRNLPQRLAYDETEDEFHHPMHPSQRMPGYHDPDVDEERHSPTSFQETPRHYARGEQRAFSEAEMEERRNKFFDDYDDTDHYQAYHKKKYSNLQVLDLILYVISGIILIFLLEQFVRIGINLSQS